MDKKSWDLRAEREEVWGLISEALYSGCMRYRL
jgi:hypothetical protein